MKRVLLFLSLIISISCSAQVTTNVLSGYDPVSGRPGYKVYDTTRTYFYKSPLYVDHDTIKTTGGSSVFSLNGTNAYYNNGRVGVGVIAPRSRFQLESGYTTNVPIDTMGFMISDTAKWNSSNAAYYPVSPPFIMETSGQFSSAARKERFRIYVQGANADKPYIYFQSAGDTSNYTTWMWLAGVYPQFPNGINSYGGNFNNTVINTARTSLSGLNILNYASGNTSIGANPYQSYTIDPSAILGLYSGGIQGLLLPKLTTAQRDSIGWTVGSITITNGGSGYGVAPGVSYSLANPSAPATNGTLSNGGNTPTGTVVTISGGAVTAITITNGGYYNGAVKIVLNSSGTGGTGATAKANMSRLLPDGLEIYCTDCVATDASTGVVQVWQNSSQTWKNAW